MINTYRFFTGLFISLWFVFFTSFESSAQEIGGTANPISAERAYNSMSSSILSGSGHVTASFQPGEAGYHTKLFTFNDIILFSYFNDSEFTIMDEAGNIVYTGTLHAGDFHSEFVGRGVYTVTGPKPFTVLAGDPVSNIVQGYFAVDQHGRGTSTLLNTYMMGEFEDGKFIIFGYEDNTVFHVSNLKTGEMLADGVLNKGENYTFPDTPFDSFLQVSANKPVSALSYGDQDFYVPAGNGTFSGTSFYGYSGYIRGWTNSVTVSSYHDDNHVVILDSESGKVLASKTLGRGQVMSHPLTSPTYWEVQAQKTVTTASIPFAGWVGNYYYKARVMGQTGIGPDKLFYVPSIASMIDVFSFENDNDVTVTYLGDYASFPYNKSSQEIVFEGTLQAGDRFNFFSKFGNHVYMVESSGDVSVIQSNGDSGADFMPLNRVQELQSSLTISVTAPSELGIEKDTLTPNPFIAEAGILNQSMVTAENVTVSLRLSDGLSLVEGAQDTSITSLSANSLFKLKWILRADTESAGTNNIVIRVYADNAKTREEEHAVVVPGPGMMAPAAPVNLAADVTRGNNSNILLSWTPNMEENLEGYHIYYGTSSGVYDGTEADQGVSPVLVSTISEFELSGLPGDGTQYYFALRAMNDVNSLSDFSNEATVTLLHKNNGRGKNSPKAYTIEQNFPNPFNPSTNIRFSLPETSHVEIQLYDLSGRRVSTLVNETRSSGLHSITVDMSSLSSGIYIYQMRAGTFVENRKLTLVK